MRILTAEDDKILRNLLNSTLEKWGHEIVACTNGQEAWDHLDEEDSPELAILDWMMPGMEGLRICRMLREAGSEKYLILLTSRGRRENIVEGLESGADDYVTKPFNPAELRARIAVGERIVTLQRRLREMSLIDPLTELPNRRRLDQTLGGEWRRAQRLGHPIAALMIDIDNFKKYNDLYGHAAGDKCLTEVAQALAACVHRAGDLVVRFGGEEFIVLLPDTTSEDAGQVAEQMRRAVADLRIEHAESRAGRGIVTISVGVADARPCPDDATPAANLIEAADRALYVAKSADGNVIRRDGGSSEGEAAQAG